MPIFETESKQELVLTILDKIIFACDSAFIGNNEFKDSLKYIFKVKNLTFLASSEGSIYKEIFNYYKSEITNDIYPNSYKAIRDVIKKFPQVPQDSVKKAFNDIYKDVFKKYQYFPLEKLVELLNEDIEKEEIEGKIIESAFDVVNGNLDVIKLQNLSSLIGSISKPVDKNKEVDIIRDKLSTSNGSDDPLESLLTKRDLRQHHGFSTLEVDELINGFIDLQKEPPKLIKGIDFLKEDFGQSACIYPNLLPAHGVTILAGSPGSGKTPLAFDCAFSYLNNLPFLGEQPSVLARKVNKRLLILNSDQQPSETQRMLLNSDHVHTCGDSWDIQHNWTMQDWVQLETSVKVVGYDLIIVDSFIAIHEHLSAFDESSPGARNAIKKFQELCAKYKTTVILIAHSNKIYDKPINAVTGRATIVGAASCLWVLQKDDNNPYTKILHIPKIKNDEPRSLVVLFDKNNYSHNTTNTASSKAYVNAENILKIFSSDIDKYKKWTIEEILKCYYYQAKEETRALLYKALNKLEQLGEIKKEINPNNYKERLYSLKLEPVTVEIKAHVLEDDLDEVVRELEESKELDF